ncbi:MAG: urea carboxylase-associated family protein [Planktomarina sp.]
MKLNNPHHPAPTDADARRGVKVQVCYPLDTLPAIDLAGAKARRAGAVLSHSVLVPAREAACIDVPAGHFARVVSVDGPQVGDLNIWNTHDISERFFSGKTRALHGTHVSTGDSLWSNLPYMRPLAHVTDDSLDWYGYDADGGSVHDVIGTRCDPYTGRLLNGDDYHHCCHSNLTRAVADRFDLPLARAELQVHDVLNVFMLTGFTHATHQYFMKASPVRPGDYFEIEAQIDITLGLSACPGGDCGDEHSSDVAACHPLLMEVYAPASLDGFVAAEVNPYDRMHGR